MVHVIHVICEPPSRSLVRQAKPFADIRYQLPSLPRGGGIRERSGLLWAAGRRHADDPSKSLARRMAADTRRPHFGVPRRVRCRRCLQRQRLGSGIRGRHGLWLWWEHGRAKQRGLAEHRRQRGGAGREPRVSVGELYRQGGAYRCMDAGKPEVRWRARGSVLPLHWVRNTALDGG